MQEKTYYEVVMTIQKTTGIEIDENNFDIKDVENILNSKTFVASFESYKSATNFLNKLYGIAEVIRNEKTNK